MEITPTAIPEVVTLAPRRFGDDRGSFSETFRSEWFPDLEFIQDNHSFSRAANTIRGLHFQLAPASQAKLLRVAKGSIRDVAIDLRKGSPTYLQHVAVDLTAEGGEQVLVPGNFAHGFITLEPDTIVLYKVTAYYDPDLERGIAWNDPALDIDWGNPTDVVLSQRDRQHPPFDPAHAPFSYEGS